MAVAPSSGAAATVRLPDPRRSYAVLIGSSRYRSAGLSDLPAVARNLAGLVDANSTEFDPDTPYPVIATMADQEDVVAGERDMGGTMRLGLYPAELAEGSLVGKLYGTGLVQERHRHRYEVNNAFRDALEGAGLRCSGLSPDGRLVEFVELAQDIHPYLVATQAHPEFLSRPTRPHPLFQGLVAAALEHSRSARSAETASVRPAAASA